VRGAEAPGRGLAGAAAHGRTGSRTSLRGTRPYHPAL
jgi:hypothetical protein